MTAQRAKSFACCMRSTGMHRREGWPKDLVSAHCSVARGGGEGTATHQCTLNTSTRDSVYSPCAIASGSHGCRGCILDAASCSQSSVLRRLLLHCFLSLTSHCFRLCLDLLRLHSRTLVLIAL